MHVSKLLRPSFRSLARLATLGLAVLLPLACSGGGGGGAADLKAADVTGTWSITETVTAANGTICDAVNTVSTFNATISVSGSTVTITPDGGTPFTLTLSGSRVRGTSIDVGTLMRDEATFDFGIVGGQIDGSYTLLELATTPSGATTSTLCTSTRKLVGARVGGTPTTSSFNGNWSVTTTSTSASPSGCSDSSDAFSTAISISGSTATLTETGQAPFTLPVVGGRLQGSQSQSVAGGFVITVTFDIGLATANSQSGTLVSVTRLGGTTVCTENLTWTASRL